MAQLLERITLHCSEVVVTEEVVKTAAGNEYSGKEVMKLLLEQRGADVDITEEVVKVAAGKVWTGGHDSDPVGRRGRT